MTISNKYKIEQKYIKLGNARSGQKIKKVLFLVAHETANPTADADDHFKYFNNQQPKASAHTFIDDGKILEIVPLTEKAYHVWYERTLDNQLFGDDANDAAIGVELCRTGDFKKAYDKYVWYFAYLCKKFGLNPKKHIISHKKLDPARRNDPDSWLNLNGYTYGEFIDDVVDCYNQWDPKPTPKPTPVKKVPYPGKLIAKGSRGSNVKLVQKELGVTADGILGAKTEAAIKTFQKKNGLSPDGIVGKLTWSKMF